MKIGFWVLALSMIAVTAQADNPIAPDSQLPNFGMVTRYIYRGGRPNLQNNGIQELSSLGVRAIIDLEGGDVKSPTLRGDYVRLGLPATLEGEPGEFARAIDAEKKAASILAKPIEFIHIPLDSFDPVSTQEADNIDRILQILHDHEISRQPIYIHCEHGQDRTGMIVALYRLRYDNWSIKEVKEEMREMGHGLLQQVFTSEMEHYIDVEGPHLIAEREADNALTQEAHANTLGQQ